MALYGYARVSTSDQDCTLQEQALRAAGCEVIRAEKVSATRREGQTELALLLEFLRRGDTLALEVGYQTGEQPTRRGPWAPHGLCVSRGGGVKDALRSPGRRAA